MDLANYYKISIYYLLGNGDNINIQKGYFYNEIFIAFITLFNLNLTEFKIDSAKLFVFQSSYEVIVNFFIEHLKILDLKVSIDSDIYEGVINNLLSKYDIEIK